MSNIEDRQQYNRMIIDILVAAVERFPEQRFGQILRNLQIVEEQQQSGGPWKNEFNTESADLILRMGKYKEILEGMGCVVDDNNRMYAKRLEAYRKIKK